MKRDDLFWYLRGQDFSEKGANTALEIIFEWRERGVPLWPLANKRDYRRTGIVLGGALEKGKPVRFFAPVCPDYPAHSITGELNTGLGETVPLFLPFLDGLLDPLKERGVAFHFNMIMADTETDLEEVVSLLADSPEDFLKRCQKSVEAIRKRVPQGVEVSTFSEFFQGTWHRMQNFWEQVTRKKMEEDQKFQRWVRLLAAKRTRKYQEQFGRRLDGSEKVGMAVRHYAQYLTLGYWMRQYHGAMMLNTNSPNLKAIRKPFVLKTPPSFLPLVEGQRQRIPIIIPNNAP